MGIRILQCQTSAVDRQAAREILRPGEHPIARSVLHHRKYTLAVSDVAKDIRNACVAIQRKNRGTFTAIRLGRHAREV